MPSVPIAPSYAGILKGAGLARDEAASCERMGAILLGASGLGAAAGWGWALWTLVAWRGGAAAHVSPLAVVAVALLGFAVFLLGWTMCGNFKRRAMSLRLAADLALAQRDVAINSYRVPVINVHAPAPVEAPVAASRQRPLTPPAPRSTSHSTMLQAA